MIKKTVTYETYDEPPKTVTEDFYFNYNKLEIIEKFELGKLQEKMERLATDANTREAYDIFKEILLDGYGRRSSENRGFDKTPELRQYLKSSPALEEIVFDLLKNEEEAGKFMNGMFPANLVAEAKKMQAEKDAANKKSLETSTETVELPTAPPVLESNEEPDVAGKKIHDYTSAELLAMSQEEFDNLAGTDPQKMTRDIMVIAMRRKTQN